MLPRRALIDSLAPRSARMSKAQAPLKPVCLVSRIRRPRQKLGVIAGSSATARRATPTTASAACGPEPYPRALGEEDEFGSSASERAVELRVSNIEHAHFRQREDELGTQSSGPKLLGDWLAVVPSEQHH